MELAERAGLSAKAVSALERGVRRRPYPHTVRVLAYALDLSAEDRALLLEAAGGRPRAADATLRVVQLPRDIADFTGRESELAQAEAALSRTGAESPAMPVLAIAGGPGVGKSALAVHLAHLLGARFPDGQLYLNLQGATAGVAPLQPLDALSRLLRSFGVEPAALPIDADEAAARFRSLAAGRRLLVVLDNARGAEQVRPLLPGTPSCAVVVTSRRALTTLEGTIALHLRGLPAHHALHLLGRIAGQRVTAEPEAAAEVVRWCDQLPLAIRIAGARLAARPGWPLQELARHLADAAHRLAALQVGELAVRASFEVSLEALRDSPDPIDQGAAAAFGLLSLPDGPDLGIAAASRLLDQPAPATQALLERLVDAQLMETLRPGRYEFHDLVRLYAREHALCEHPESTRLAALTRTFGFYTATAWRTVALLRPGAWRLDTADSRWTVGGLGFGNAAAALNWLEAERVNLLAAVTQAARLITDRDSAVPADLPGQLARALFSFFEVRGYWHDWVLANETALALARRIEDRTAQAGVNNDLSIAYERLGRYQEALACLDDSLATFRELGDLQGQGVGLGNLGTIYTRLGRHEEALGCQQGSLAIFRELGDRQGQARCLINLSLAYEGPRRHEEALACLQQALAVCRELGDGQGQARSLNNLGLVLERLGRHTEALAHLQESLALARELGDRMVQAFNLNNIGLVYERLGQHAQASSCHRDSLTIFRDLGARGRQAVVLRDLGDALRSEGRRQQARLAWQEALAIGESLHIPEADEIRARLVALAPDKTGPMGGGHASG